jgi:selenocysteine-specific elongation factor
MNGPLTLGTAGHIDHGKTALINALTGTNTDRLPEEQSRGISIALGYASLQTPAGRSLSIIDVPGHERFVRTMVAGATGIDAFLMVIAADDGVMPQTIEHATVLQALDVRNGVVAFTKADVLDPTLAIEDARELLPDCEIVACSARTGEGLTNLLTAIDGALQDLPSRASHPGGVVLHIDRVFSLRGHGTIVTGTLWSGPLARGETLALLPAETRIRVREIEVHDQSVEQADAGQRVAVNLAGVRAREVQRGDVLATPKSLEETRTLDCMLALKDAEHNIRIHAHHGTREAPGRLVALDDGELWQLRLERPLIAADGDRLVIRRPSPPDTLGGGVILDAHARRHGRRPEILARLERRRDGQPDPPPAPPAPVEPARVSAPAVVIAESTLREVEQLVRAANMQPVSGARLDSAAVRALRSAEAIVRVSGELYLHADAVNEARERVLLMFERSETVTIVAIRDELEISRKAAQALLEHFDTIGLTRRLPDDRRMLHPRAVRARTRA